MDLQTLRFKINEFYLESKNREYPNSLLVTKDQYKDFLKETFKVPDFSEIPDGQKRPSRIVITAYLWACS